MIGDFCSLFHGTSVGHSAVFTLHSSTPFLQSATRVALQVVEDLRSSTALVRDAVAAEAMLLRAPSVAQSGGDSESALSEEHQGVGVDDKTALSNFRCDEELEKRTEVPETALRKPPISSSQRCLARAMCVPLDVYRHSEHWLFFDEDCPATLEEYVALASSLSDGPDHRTQMIETIGQQLTDLIVAWSTCGAQWCPSVAQSYPLRGDGLATTTTSSTVRQTELETRGGEPHQQQPSMQRAAGYVSLSIRSLADFGVDYSDVSREIVLPSHSFECIVKLRHTAARLCASVSLTQTKDDGAQSPNALRLLDVPTADSAWKFVVYHSPKQFYVSVHFAKRHVNSIALHPADDLWSIGALLFEVLVRLSWPSKREPQKPSAQDASVYRLLQCILQASSSESRLAPPEDMKTLFKGLELVRQALQRRVESVQSSATETTASGSLAGAVADAILAAVCPSGVARVIAFLHPDECERWNNRCSGASPQGSNEANCSYTAPSHDGAEEWSPDSLDAGSNGPACIRRVSPLLPAAWLPRAVEAAKVRSSHAFQADYAAWKAVTERHATTQNGCLGGMATKASALVSAWMELLFGVATPGHPNHRAVVAETATDGGGGAGFVAAAQQHRLLNGAAAFLRSVLRSHQLDVMATHWLPEERSSRGMHHGRSVVWGPVRCALLSRLFKNDPSSVQRQQNVGLPAQYHVPSVMAMLSVSYNPTSGSILERLSGGHRRGGGGGAGSQRQPSRSSSSSPSPSSRGETSAFGADERRMIEMALATTSSDRDVAHWRDVLLRFDSRGSPQATFQCVPPLVGVPALLRAHIWRRWLILSSTGRRPSSSSANQHPTAAVASTPAAALSDPRAVVLYGSLEQVAQVLDALDTDVANCNDRQIAVDIPRCHQYDAFLSSGTGHLKMFRVVKAWLALHPSMIYWQGIDSVCAVLLSVAHGHEALSLSLLTLVMQRWVPHFFVATEVGSMEQRLLQTSLLLRFFDPLLAFHLEDIDCRPELFSIPWFLTVFAHVLPLEKVFVVWDFLFESGCPEAVLCVAVAVLMELRASLMAARDFSSAIAALGSVSALDLIRVVSEAKELLVQSPPTILKPDFQNPGTSSLIRTSCCSLLEVRDLVLAARGSETSIDYSATSCESAPHWALSGGVFLLDVRTPHEFASQGLLTASLSEMMEDGCWLPPREATRVVGAVSMPFDTLRGWYRSVAIKKSNSTRMDSVASSPSGTRAGDSHADLAEVDIGEETGTDIGSDKNDADAILHLLCRRRLAWLAPRISISEATRNNSGGDAESPAGALAASPVVVILHEKQPEDAQAAVELLCRAGVPKVTMLVGGIASIKRDRNADVLLSP